MTPSRARRSVFGDVRFLIGIVLVVASIAGVWLLVTSSRQTAPALQATRTIVPGEAIDSGDFQVVDVGLGAVAGSYLAPQDLEPGSVATRTLAEGDAAEARTTTVVVTSTAIPAGVRAGTPVELWHAPLGEDGRSFEEPRVLVADAVVATVGEAEGMLSQSSTDVELVIDRGDVADVLTAISGGSAISVIPAGGAS